MTAASGSGRSWRAMPWLLALYAGASLVHFTHNAEELAQYPQLPASWTRTVVYLAWCCVTAVGLLGYGLYRRGSVRAGLTVLALYGGLGFGGLLHYTRAPMAQHSAGMNFTIWAEVAAATLFLICLASVAASRLRRDTRGFGER